MAEVKEEDISPGKLLATARKKAGLSESDIAEQLNLSVAMIGQLESDQNTSGLPDAFLRGYLRTYARAVGEDEEHIVALYSQAIGTSIVRNYFVPSVDVPPMKAQVGNHMPWFKALSVAVFIAIIALGWMAYSQKSTDTNSENSTIYQPLNSSEYNEVAEDSVQQPVELSSDIDNGDIGPAITNTSESEPLFVEPTIEPESDIESMEAELAFTFIEDCWVQVIDSNDNVLAVGLKSAGRRFTVSGVPPIAVVLGKPRAISLQFNNEAVDLSIYAAGQTARFSLGEE